MRTTKTVVAAIAALMAIGCAQDQSNQSAAGTVRPAPTSEGEAKRAVASLESRSGSNVTGRAEFTETGEGVRLVLTVEGAEPGERGVHLHAIGDCSAPDASSAGDHWNPTEEAHGKLGETDHAHLGDMGNITIDENGRGTLEFTSSRWTIGGPDETNIVGRSIVVHAGTDDLKTQPSGDSGDRVGCGVIEMS